VCFQSKGEATTAFQNRYGYFWSRRRQSTSVNGVCQARTTTSGILLGKRGIKKHNSRILLVENHGNPRQSWAGTLPGRREGCSGTIAPGRSEETVQCHPTRLRRWGWGNKAWNWCSFGGRVWELWRRGPGMGWCGRRCANPDENSGITCDNG